jgi:hypothetical protein
MSAVMRDEMRADMPVSAPGEIEFCLNGQNVRAHAGGPLLLPCAQGWHASAKRQPASVGGAKNGA